jgi:ATP-dependent RNA helicase DDX31/DBP7
MDPAGLIESIAMQAQLLAHVEAKRELKELAGNAFRSYVGAYATHSHHLQHIFHVKNLHLGHVAYSFALKDRPKKLGQQAARKNRKQSKAANERKAVHIKRRRVMRKQGAEFNTDNGLV